MTPNVGFMEILLESAAWTKMSQELALSEDMMIEYRNKLDWTQVSDNSKILWTASMLDKFKDKLNWNLLSSLSSDYLFSVAHLEQFKMYWNWSELSENSSIKFTDQLIERFADHWDWKNLINQWHLEELYDNDFYDKYCKYISPTELHSSLLWDKMVESKAMELTADILSPSK